ncbi:MAG: DNA repair protein RadC [Acidobacteriota bacterium]
MAVHCQWGLLISRQYGSRFLDGRFYGTRCNIPARSPSRTLRIRALPKGERPRERMQSHGPSALADRELLALVLGSGCAGASALELAERLLANGSDLRKLAPRGIDEWMAEPGIGTALSARLAAVFEICRRVRARAPRRGQAIRHPRQVVGYLSGRWADARAECFGMLLLDSRNRLLGEKLLSRGGWSASVVRPREVFRHALLAGAPALILYHNHPSGDPAPSREDVQITRQLVEAGQLMGVRVLDHLIVGVEGYASLRERGLI